MLAYLGVTSKHTLACHELGSVESTALRSTRKRDPANYEEAHVAAGPAAGIINITACTDKNACTVRPTKKRHQNRVNMAARARLSGFSVARGAVTH